jgi:mRNA interferase MazF
VVAPDRGEIWWYDPDPVRGHEQGSRRPGLIISTALFNRSARELVVVLPLTRRVRRVRFRVELSPEESGLPFPSFIMCDQIRTISIHRLLDTQPVGRVGSTTFARVNDDLRTILELFDIP